MITNYEFVIRNDDLGISPRLPFGGPAANLNGPEGNFSPASSEVRPPAGSSWAVHLFTPSGGAAPPPAKKPKPSCMMISDAAMKPKMFSAGPG